LSITEKRFSFLNGEDLGYAPTGANGIIRDRPHRESHLESTQETNVMLTPLAAEDPETAGRSQSNKKRRPAVLLARRPRPLDTHDRDSQDAGPHLEFLALAAALNAQLVSYDDLSQLTAPWFAKLFKSKPIIGAALAGFLKRKEFDVIYATGEDLGLRLALLLKMTRWSGRIVMATHNIAHPKRKMLLRAIGPEIFEKIICVCRSQCDACMDSCNFPQSKVMFTPNWIDTQFFSPIAPDASTTPYVFSCGKEGRDYATLAKAAATSSIQFKVVASGWMTLTSREKETQNDGWPSNMTIFGRIPYTQLRMLYGQSQFVVVPLYEANYAAGVTGVVEAMAMGKAVIMTRSPGLADYFGEGTLMVPPNCPEELARAIETLWASPKLCERMGRFNRKWAEDNADVRLFASRVAAIMT
jgi:glycosyltransferase involved in cell wall biosynthesis